MDRIEEYRNLAIAIISDTCNDYKRGKLSEETFKKYMKSKWFSTLFAFLGCRSTNAEWLIAQMKLEREDYINGKKGVKRYIQHDN